MANIMSTIRTSAMSAANSTYIIAPRGKHTHTIILLHGRNSTGPDFADEIFEGININATAFGGCKWIFPTSSAAWSKQFQEDLTEWFDLASTSNPYNEQERQVAGLEASVRRIHILIKEELKHVSGSNIVLGGMSQGYATSAHVLLSCKERLGGFLGISGWMPFCKEVKNPWSTNSTRPFHMSEIEMCSGVNINIPMLLTHMKDDEVIKVNLGKQARTAWQELGFEPVWKEYEDGGHEIQETKGFADIEKFLVGVVGK